MTYEYTEIDRIPLEELDALGWLGWHPTPCFRYDERLWNKSLQEHEPGGYSGLLYREVPEDD